MNTTAPPRAEYESLPAFLAQTLSDAERDHVFLPSFGQWPFSLAALTEIALDLHAMGSRVSIGLWGPYTPLDDVAWSSPRWIAHAVGSRTRDEQVQSALRKAGIPASAFIDPPIRDWRPVEPLHEPTERIRSSIRALTYRGSPMGRGILQLRPDHAVPVTDEYMWPQRWLALSMQSYAYVYDQVRQVIEQRGVTALAVSNGRFLHDRAAAEAGIDAGIAVLYYDSGGVDTAFDLTRDNTHDWAALQVRMHAMWDAFPENERREIGESWFIGRRTHADPTNRHFTDAQKIGTGIDAEPGKRLVVFFSSSGDEFAELELEWSEYFGGQPQALLALAQACRQHDDVTFVVRSHPHKRRKAREDVRDWHMAVAAAQPDMHLDEFSDVDSYALMQQADVVVTYGSTTGVEAAALGRAVIVMGPSAYDELGCAVRPRTQAELEQALAAITTGDIDGALKFGLMMKRRGFHLAHQRRNADGSLALAGTTVGEPSELARKLAHIRAKRKRVHISHGAWE